MGQDEYVIKEESPTRFSGWQGISVSGFPCLGIPTWAFPTKSLQRSEKLVGLYL
jgi:hypothetical protein